MKFYLDILKLIKNIVILKKSNGEAIRIFCNNNGLAYIKLAQILATQNYGTLFSEEDRRDLEAICDNSNPLSFDEIKSILISEYGDLEKTFLSIEEIPLGSASISQVHKATLKDGTVVALKIKRRDITNTLETDLKRLSKIITSYISFLRKHSHVRTIISKFIPILNLTNQSGFDKAFLLYYSWILDETDFIHEAQNIASYTNFAKQVNGKIPDVKDIVIPKIYSDLCSENVIVMEYIPFPNFNHIDNNDAKLTALNSYLKLSFYAMFNDIDVYFHGDPHGGNIYLDNDGNIGFLDMGLLFKLSKEDLKLTKEFFLSAYSGNSKKLFKMLTQYAKLTDEEVVNFQKEVDNYCLSVNDKTVTAYFTDMINICLKYNISPPNFLFSMAKAFVCLNGISYLANNDISAFDLLKKQVIEYLLMENINGLKNLSIRVLKISPNILHSGIRFALHKTLPQSDCDKILEELKNEDVRKALNDALDFLHLLKNIGNDSLGR